MEGSHLPLSRVDLRSRECRVEENDIVDGIQRERAWQPNKKWASEKCSIAVCPERVLTTHLSNHELHLRGHVNGLSRGGPGAGAGGAGTPPNECIAFMNDSSADGVSLLRIAGREAREQISDSKGGGERRSGGKGTNNVRFEVLQFMPDNDSIHAPSKGFGEYVRSFCAVRI